MNNNNFLDKFKKVTWILTPFILLAVAIILLIQHCNQKKECLDCTKLEKHIDNIEQKIKDKDCLDCDWENIDGEEVQEPTENDTIIDGEIVQKPTNNCRAFFSGRLVTDDPEYNESVIFHPNNQSEYVGEGNYPRANIAFPNSDKHTFDGIAIDKNTRVIIYSNKDFEGSVLLDITGPALINNIKWKGTALESMIKEINNKNLQGNLNEVFPENSRQYSKSDMHSWSNGSLKILCDE